MPRRRSKEEIQRDKESAWTNAPRQGYYPCAQCSKLAHSRGSVTMKCRECFFGPSRAR